MRVLIVAALAAVVGGTIWAMASWKPPYDYGRRAPEVRRLSANLEREPCDRVKMLELGEVLFEAGDFRGAIERSQTFFETCGEYPRLLWIVYGSYKSLSEWQHAEQAATDLIASDPDDPDFHWWRGEVREEMNDTAGAITDYEQTMALLPQARVIPQRLADLYEQTDRPCDAVATLEQYLFYHPDEATSVESRIGRLTEAGDCAGPEGARRVVIRFRPGDGVITTSARFNDQKTGRFIVDTGASHTAISAEFARAIDFQPSPGTMLVHTTNGVIAGQFGFADIIEVGGLRSRRVRTLVLEEDSFAGYDGVLGLSFLTAFDVRIKRDAGELVLSRGELSDADGARIAVRDSSRVTKDPVGGAAAEEPTGSPAPSRPRAKPATGGARGPTRIAALVDGCEAGHAKDCSELSSRFVAGDGIPADQGEAIRYGRRACRLGSNKDCAALQQLCDIGIASACPD